MERLRKRIASLPKPELKAPPQATLTAEGAMRAAMDHSIDAPPQAPLPEKADDREFEPDMTIWEGLVNG